MAAISIHELHEQTALWVRRATEEEPVVLTEDGHAVAKIVPISAAEASNRYLHP